MAQSPEDTLFLEGRAIHGQEFDSWAANLLAVLQSRERGGSCLSQLRQMLVLVGVTKYNRNLSSSVFRNLRSIVLEPEQGPPKLRILAAAILRELSPLQKSLVRDFNPPTDPQNIQYVLTVLLSQGNVRDQAAQLIPHLFKWLTHLGVDEELCVAAIPCLYILCTNSTAMEKLTEDQLGKIHSQLSHWLRHASKSSLALSSSGISIFSSGGKKQLVPMKEIDGSTSQEIFTILSICDYYASDHLLNIHTFSLLRRWLIYTLSPSSTTRVEPSPSPALTPTMESLSLSREHTPPSQEFLRSSLSSTPTWASLSFKGGHHGLKDAAIHYCLRVIDQCERRPAKSYDDEMIKACLYEAVTTLDLLCSIRQRLIHEVFPTMKSLFVRVSQEDGYAHVLLALVKFFINHGESEMYSYELGMQSFFGVCLSNKFNDPGIAYDVIRFCIENLEHLCNATTVFTRFFPNLLKILAWSPPTYLAEFLQLLPAFVSANTATEVLHSLLDLPCMSAVLTANYILASAPGAIETHFSQYTSCLAAFQEPSHKLLFGHFLRSESGRGDTIDRLPYLHSVLSEFSSHQRVLLAAEVTPLLLRVYFKVVLYGGEKKLVSELVSVLLERVLCLYSTSGFSETLRVEIAEQLLAIFKAQPTLLVDHAKEIVEFLINLRTLNSGGKDFYTHLVWLVGEYAHTGYDPRCTANVLSQFFETLEMVGYEVAMNGDRNVIPVRLILIIMSTLAKLASRCQDLIPRSLLCLNKIVKLSVEKIKEPSCQKLLLNRASELVNILKMPSVASAVLTPPINSCDVVEVQRQMNVARLMQATTHMITTTRK